MSNPKARSVICCMLPLIVRVNTTRNHAISRDLMQQQIRASLWMI